MEIKTLGDLKGFLNTLNEAQLNQSAIICQEETFVRIGEAYVSETTFYHNEDSEGIIPVEDYDPEWYEGIPLTDTEFNTIVPPGRVFIDEECYFGDEPKPDPVETLSEVVDRLYVKFRPLTVLDIKPFANEVASVHFHNQMNRIKTVKA